ncbi:MAG: nucleotidyltransferase domain-containing protein [Candidatus Odinarchaeota archaeon]
MKVENESSKAIRERYSATVNRFCDKLKEDPCILAVILSGSLSYDEVWEKSDIDIIVVHDDEKSPFADINLIEDGIYIDAHVISRNQFKKEVEGGIQGRLFHSFVSTSTILYSKDQTIDEYFNDIMEIGNKDREIQLLRHYSEARRTIDYAQKMLYHRNDLFHAFHEIIYAAPVLARVETIMAGKIPRREVLRQALQLNPSFFNTIYTDLLMGEKDYQTLHGVLERIESYLDGRLETVYKPVLDYLVGEGTPCTESELNERLNRNGVFHTPFFQSYRYINYYFLADKGLVSRVTSPLKLTKKGIHVQEPAYFYDGTHGNVVTGTAEPLTDSQKQEFADHYETALAAFTDQLEKDPTAIAVLLCGSMATNNAWQKSDINVIIIHDDEKTPSRRNIRLIEHEIRFLASVYYIDDFKKLVEANMRGNNTHSMLANSRFLFTKDLLLEEQMEDINYVGKESEWQMMYNYAGACYNLEKARKMLQVKDDVYYCYYYVLMLTYSLNRIEALMNREIIELETLNQAIRLNPEFFNDLRGKLMAASGDREEMRKKLLGMLEKADRYLTERIKTVYRPVLKYLEEQGVPVPESELDEHFANLNVPVVCYPLVDKGIITQTTSPRNLFRRSSVHVDEPAFYHNG